MAYQEHFSFATHSELWPIYYVDDAEFLPFEFFNDSMMDTAHEDQQSNVVENVNSLPFPLSSSALLTDTTDFFTNSPNPYLENHWEQPFAVPESQVPVAHVAQQSLSSAASNDDELGFALALNSEPEIQQQPTQYHHYFAVPPSQNMHCTNDMFYGHNQPLEQPNTVKSSKRRVIDDEDIDELAFESESMDFGDEEDPTGGFKLPASKSPIMEAMVVCALNGWGIEIITNNRPTSASPAEVVFKVTDFNRYYKISRAICSKQRPTDDLGSRIKSLRRWFVNFPKKKDRIENAFNLIVKPTIAKKVNEIIERNTKTLGLTKRRRRQ